MRRVGELSVTERYRVCISDARRLPFWNTGATLNVGNPPIQSHLLVAFENTLKLVFPTFIGCWSYVITIRGPSACSCSALDRLPIQRHGVQVADRVWWRVSRTSHRDLVKACAAFVNHAALLFLILCAALQQRCCNGARCVPKADRTTGVNSGVYDPRSS